LGLVAYLADARAPVGRDHMAGLLWPDHLKTIGKVLGPRLAFRRARTAKAELRDLTIARHSDVKVRRTRQTLNFWRTCGNRPTHRLGKGECSFALAAPPRVGMSDATAEGSEGY
jgi:hypothetical protein